MTYLLQIGYGREGRFDGFTRVGLDEASFNLAKTLCEEYDDDELWKIKKDSMPAVVLMVALMLKIEFEYLDIEVEDAENPLVLAAAEKWGLCQAVGPFQDVHTIMIWNTYN